jgi:transcriptional regulator with XRE-family HTH domain
VESGSEFGSLLRALREESGLTQGALAEAASVDITTVNRLERGKGSAPRQGTILKLAQGLGLDQNNATVVKLLQAANRSVPRRIQARQSSPLQPPSLVLPPEINATVQLIPQLAKDVAALGTQIAELQERLEALIRSEQQVISGPGIRWGLTNDDFSEAITAAKSNPGEAFWVKDGIPSDTMPVDQSWYIQRVSQMFEANHAEQLIKQRTIRVKAQLSGLGISDYRQIITRSSVERFLLHGIPNYDEDEAIQHPGWIVPAEERIARIGNFLKFLQHENYSVALIDKPYLEVWWAIYHNRKAMWQLYPEEWEGTWAESEVPLVVYMWRAKFLRKWDSIAKENKDKTLIVGWIKGLLRQLQQSSVR